MAKYESAEMKVIKVDSEDVITTSGGCSGVNQINAGGLCDSGDSGLCLFGNSGSGGGTSCGIADAW